MKPFRRQFSSGVVAMALLTEGAFAASIPVRTAALSGDPAPGLKGATFQLDPGLGVVATPVINEEGTIAFIAEANGVGVWAGTPGTLQLMGHVSVEAPDTDPGVTFQSLGYFVLGATGDLVFMGTLQGPGVGAANDAGIWVGPPGAPSLLAREGDAAPGAGDGVVFESLLTSMFPQPHLTSDPATIVFGATLQGIGVTADNSRGIWSGPPAGPLQLRARTGSQAPGFPIGVYYQTLSFPAANGAGAIVFHGTTTDASAGLWSGPPGGLARALGSGAVPGLPGATFLSFSTSGIDNAGRITVVASFLHPATSESGPGIWHGAGDQMELVVRGGSTAADAPGTSARFAAFNGTPTVAAESGEFAFSGTLAAGDGIHSGNDTGIWAGTPEQLQLVAREGNQAPGLPPGVVFASLGFPIHLNNRGDILFTGTLAGPGIDPTNDEGYWGGPLDQVRLLIRKGDTIEVVPGVVQVIDALPPPRPPYGGNANGNVVLNDSGEFVFQAGFAGFTGPSGGVFIANLTIPPTLILQSVDGSLQLSWEAEGFTLYATDDVAGTWNPAPSQDNPQTLNPTGERRFFQLSDRAP